jgi:hypothetical protein
MQDSPTQDTSIQPQGLDPSGSETAVLRFMCAHITTHTVKSGIEMNLNQKHVSIALSILGTVLYL